MASASTTSDLAKVTGTARAPLLIDVRREEVFNGADDMIAGAIRRSPDAVDQWHGDLPERSPIVVYCAHGQQVSQGIALALGNKEIGASYLEGGISAWVDQKLPIRRKRDGEEHRPTNWVTRERPKIDRIACPWLIRRFIDPTANSSTFPRIASWRPQAKPAPHHTTSTASSSRMRAIAARSIRSCASTALKIRRSIIWRNRARRRYLAARSDAAMRRPVCDLARAFGKLSRRSRDAEARHGDLRRALSPGAAASRRDATTGRLVSKRIRRG